MARQVDERVAWVRRRASLVVWALVREAVSWRRGRGRISVAGVVWVAIGAMKGLDTEGLVVVRLEREERQ